MKPKTVDAYIAAAPKDVQDTLKLLRETIKKAAPKAEEKISYSMPYYGYKGRLAYFAYFKTHIGLYVMPPIVDMFKKELKGYTASNATIQLPLDKKLPVALITKLIKARMKYIDHAGRK